MRIAVWHNLPSGGGKRAMFYHLKGLKERGHQIEIWTTPLADNQYLDFQSIGPIHIVPLAPPANPIPASDRIGYLSFQQDSAMRAMEAHSRTCAEQIQAGGFEILFANSCMTYAAPYIARFVSIPTLLYLGEPLRYLHEAQPTLPWTAPEETPKWTSLAYWRMLGNDLWRERRFRVLMREERQNFWAYDQVLVNSIYSAETCARVYGKDAEVGYLGVDTEIFRPLNLEREPFVISTASFQARKDPGFIIDALSYIPAASRPALVWVANYTNPDYEAQMQQYALDAGVELTLKKMVSDEELVTLLNLASAFVYAPRLEPFGLAPLEANACGLPVVAVAESGVRESIQHLQNGLLVHRNARQMGRAIERVLQDDELWQKLSTEALEQIENKWSMKHCIDRIEEALYKTAVRKKETQP
ncbi:glycosyltransferase family 4 protein [Spirosoma flavus]